LIYSISDQCRHFLELIVESNDATFSYLVNIGGLDPKKDFRHADLKDVDFRDSDIRGFDFTGADLLGALKNSTTKIDETTIFKDARVSWIEGETQDIVNKMLQIQAAQSSKTRLRLLSELQEQYRSASHIRQFLITSMKKCGSVEEFFDFANSVHTSDDTHMNMVIRDELKRLVDKRGSGFPKGRRRLAQTPYGFSLILRLLDESINPFLKGVSEIVFRSSEPVSRESILKAIGENPSQLI
jgi:hypothetical protein